jgi:hypothetical protein
MSPVLSSDAIEIGAGQQIPIPPGADHSSAGAINARSPACALDGDELVAVGIDPAPVVENSCPTGALEAVATGWRRAGRPRAPERPTTARDVVV